MTPQAALKRAFQMGYLKALEELNDKLQTNIDRLHERLDQAYSHNEERCVNNETH